LKRHFYYYIEIHSRQRQKIAMRFLPILLDAAKAALALAGGAGHAKATLRRDSANLGRPIERGGRTRPSGIVHLVGAGPGDPDLLTLRAARVLQNADIVFHDELVTPGILNWARRDAERVFVGKRRGVPSIGQDEINRRLVEAARAGYNVVRLKGGDPFVFGRGGEELEYLRNAGIEVVVVPGITAALGCAAEAGLPLTLRDQATRLTFITAHRANDAQAIDWTGLAHAATTIAVYMGGGVAPAVRDGLIAAGRDPRTPVAVLARGTRPDAQSRTGRLAELVALAAETGEGPTLLVIGDVVAHSDLWRAAVREAASREFAA
jgi:uroporphyrin-III C-methyltransferase/precorrin-2 dehydrogenase/sirohydrochlorin ferrochelatase